MLDLRQTSHYASFMASQGWIVERIEGINYFIKRFPVVGSILKIQRPKKIDFKEIERLSKKYRVFQTILEPNLETTNVGTTTIHSQILAHGFKLSKTPYLPTKTLQIDLIQSEGAIYADLKRNIKTGIRRAKALSEHSDPKGENTLIKEYSTPQELEIFQKAWTKSVNFSRYVPSIETLINLRKSFPHSYSMILASHNIVGSIIGGVIFTRVSHDSVNYMYGFSSKAGRTSLAHAALLYHGILWAKRMGCKVFDFEGIYDERFPNKSWLGFTRFKHSFGGYEAEYPGCYTKLRLWM